MLSGVPIQWNTVQQRKRTTRDAWDREAQDQVDWIPGGQGQGGPYLAGWGKALSSESMDVRICTKSSQADRCVRVNDTYPISISKKKLIIKKGEKRQGRGRKEGNVSNRKMTEQAFPWLFLEQNTHRSMKEIGNIPWVVWGGGIFLYSDFSAFSQEICSNGELCAGRWGALGFGVT